MQIIPRKRTLVALFVALPMAIFAHEPATDMLRAAEAFLAALSPEQKQQATYALTNAERENWNFVPLARSGLPLKQMNAPQQALARALLQTGLSHSGMTKAEGTMSLENVLKELENNSARRDPTLYYVTVFGEPTAASSWGWRFEGHHLSFNFTIVDGTHVFFTPSFLGSNPAEVRTGPKQGLRILGDEEDLGRAFMLALEPEQQAIATISQTAPVEIITGNEHHVAPLHPVGIKATQLNASQRDRLGALLAVYINRYRSEIAEATLAEINSAGTENLTFAWAGGLAPGVGHYYRIQGPTFVCEFDNTQNNANHIHTVWRNFKSDFGHDALAEHYAKDHTGTRP